MTRAEFLKKLAAEPGSWLLLVAVRFSLLMALAKVADYVADYVRGTTGRSPQQMSAPAPQAKVPQAKAPARVNDRVILTSDPIGCVWSVQEKVEGHAQVRDGEAIQRLWAGGLLTGECEYFAKGEEVIVLERSAWHNMTRIKKLGAVRDFWIAGRAE